MPFYIANTNTKQIKIDESKILMPIISYPTKMERSRLDQYIVCLSNSIWVTTYAKDIYNTLQTSELKRRPLHYSTNNLNRRGEILNLLTYVSEICKLNRCTFHLSIYLLDRFLDEFVIQNDQINLAAITCLHLAAQIEDADPKIPKFGELNRIIGYKYTAQDFKQCERNVLSTLNFDLLVPTVAHFAEHLSCKFLTETDYHQHQICCTTNQCGDSFPNYDSMMYAHAKLLLNFVDLTLTCCNFSNVRPSLLAASCVACVRLHCGLEPIWTPYLTKLTTYSEKNVLSYVHLIHTIYTAYKAKETNNAENCSNNNSDGSNVNGNNNNAIVMTSKVLDTPKANEVGDIVIPEWNSPDSGIELLQDFNIIDNNEGVDALNELEASNATINDISEHRNLKHKNDAEINTEQAKRSKFG